MPTHNLTRRLAVDPDTAMRTITDLRRLPEWNAGITKVLEVPDDLTPGCEWVVTVAALDQTWPSRSRLEVLDLGAREFRYRSATDDGNPSYAGWTWRVTERPGGCEVHVTWEIHPRTFWRRVLFAPIRRRQLASSEVPASLAGLAAAARRTAPT